MTPGMKMMMLDKARRGEMRGNPRYEMTEEPMNRGYKRHKNGRFAPHSGGDEMGMEIENRFRDRQGPQYYGDGRGDSVRAERDDGVRNGYEPMDRYMPPIRETSTGYRYDGGGNRMIGFAGGGELQSNYRMDASYQNRDEMEHRTSTKKPGHSGSDMQAMNREKAQQWVRKMKNADGSTGEHWSFDQTYQLMKQRNIDCDPAEFYATMNMLWSDYGKVAEKFGLTGVEFWAELSKAFLMDKDAEDGKLMLYYECIVKK